MKHLVAALVSFVLLFQQGWAQSTADGPHIKVTLLSEHSTVIVGKQYWLGILLSPDPEWHTYWRNAGDSGEAPAVSWQTDAKINFGDIHWPIPEQIPVAHLINYGYSGDTLLMVPFTVDNLAGSDTATITADLSWLVCKEDCIPGWATLSIDIAVGEHAIASEQAKMFLETRERLPQTTQLEGQYEITEQYLTLSVQTPYNGDWQLLPFRADLIQHNAKQQWIAEEHDKTQQNVLLAKSDYFSLNDEPVNFLLTDGKQGFYLNAQLNAGVASIASTNQSLWLMMFFAFLGGLILNIMPCVLPVLSIKAMALAAGNGVGKTQKHDHWGYLAGILLSFWLFAVLILGLKASGNAIGWGFHLQEPLVIAGLSFLFLFIALMLWDVAPSGARLSGAGQKLTQGNSFSSQFFTGVLAVIVASPCTAPFMATALGIAMVSPALDTLLIFTALALGFAMPMSLLSVSSRFAALLPKPGAWMETFRQFLAFPMLATVVWLLWVFLGQTNSLGQLWLLSGLLIFALAIWLASKMKSATTYVALAAALGVAGYTSVKAVGFSPGESIQTEQSYSDTKLAVLRDDGQVVVVNMTADWCITCKVNEQVAFNDEQLQQSLAQQGVHYLVGDWTNKNQEILDFLTRYQRSGVPLYVVYAGNKSEQVLPQVLTPEIVINAIKQAQQELNHAIR
ncbi:protein-disulfide reductase DsbD family protein [Thalassotalea euphylliae]|uniref:protein-disulfide reductase DsbD family protein n=1 Tax=Thalassotalea euphylliae TaxID=1655234 RepID=UPI00363A5BF4